MLRTADGALLDKTDEQDSGAYLFRYFLIDASEDELVNLIREVTPGRLFTKVAGPFHRINPNLPSGVTPWN